MELQINLSHRLWTRKSAFRGLGVCWGALRGLAFRYVRGSLRDLVTGQPCGVDCVYADAGVCAVEFAE